MNLAAVIIAPMTSRGRNYPTRIACAFEGKDGQVALDKLRTMHKFRRVKTPAQLTDDEQ